MTPLDAEFDRYIDENVPRFLDELFQLLRQPSVSAQNLGMKECADLLAGSMTAIGIEASVMETPGQPVVFGQIHRDHAPTVLFYGHYDVQPPEPLVAWTSPPYEPEIRDGKIYGRGTSDNKAQIFCYLKAVETLKAVTGEVPLSLKFLYEGEEEVGSPSLEPFVRENLDILKADITYFCDSHIHESGRPMIILGLKGMLHVELTATGAHLDQHSMRAAALPNPAWRLVWALNTLKGSDNKVLIPGFYDHVRPLTTLERELTADIPVDENALLRFYGVKGFVNGHLEDGYYFKIVGEPTFNIAGFTSGYAGEGPKNVLPAKATAKVDIRLVPGQDPSDILEKLKIYLRRSGFEDIGVRELCRFKPTRVSSEHAAVRIIAQSLEDVYGQPPVVFPNIGGSGPNYIFTEILGAPCFLVPHATHDQANHAPDESMDLQGFVNGIKTGVRLLPRLAQELGQANSVEFSP